MPSARAVLALLCSAATSSGWHLASVDAITAKTTVRLWHQLHAARRQAHDFTPLLSPQTRDAYLAAVRYDEVRAVAACSWSAARFFAPTSTLDDDVDDLAVECVACHPDHPEAMAHLVRLLHEEGCVSWNASTVRAQPRVYLEMLALNDVAPR